MALFKYSLGKKLQQRSDSAKATSIVSLRSGFLDCLKKSFCMQLSFKKNHQFHNTAFSNKHKHLDQMLYKILWEMNDPQSIQQKATEQTMLYNFNISSFLR